MTQSIEIPNEFLSDDEIVKLTGTDKPALQIKRLEKNGWKFCTALNERNQKIPVVGRYYTRQRMSGIENSVSKKGPNFEKVL